MKKPKILIIEDNILLGVAVRDILSSEGYECTVVNDGQAAKKTLKKNKFAIAILDMMLPDSNGKELLQNWHEEYPEMMIIIVTAYGDITKAVECIKAGAYEFLVKPVEKVLLKKTIANALDHQNLSKKVKVLTQQKKIDHTPAGIDNIIANCPQMDEVINLAKVICENDFSCIFIRGESGTGKGLFARTIHQMGQRSNQPFVELNCSALPATLIESELFGHKKGAFTDAKESKTGLFELADGGTLFLDEIGDMDINLQAKLLKIIEEQHFRKIGSTTDVEIDVAIIAATNQNIEKQVKQGKFRQDLFFRLNIIPFNLPPLREHKNDLPQLCTYFIDLYNKKFNKNITGFTQEAINLMMNYSWPGNVRELRNIVERGVLLSREQQIGSNLLLFPHQDICLFSSEENTPPIPQNTTPMSLSDAEKQAIKNAMLAADNNKNKAARILGVHRTTLYKKLEEYDLER